MGWLLDDLRAFGINTDQWTTAVRTGRTEERIAQSKRVRAGSLAI